MSHFFTFKWSHIKERLSITYINRVCYVRTDATLKHNSLLLHGWLRPRVRGTKSHVLIDYLVGQKSDHIRLDVDYD